MIIRICPCCGSAVPAPEGSRDVCSNCRHALKDTFYTAEEWDALPEAGKKKAIAQYMDDGIQRDALTSLAWTKNRK